MILCEDFVFMDLKYILLHLIHFWTFFDMLLTHFVKLVAYTPKLIHDDRKWYLIILGWRLCFFGTQVHLVTFVTFFDVFGHFGHILSNCYLTHQNLFMIFILGWTHCLYGPQIHFKTFWYIFGRFRTHFVKLVAYTTK